MQFHLHPIGLVVGVLDFSNAKSLKFYKSATKRLDPKELVNCTPGNMYHFLKLLRRLTNENDWDNEMGGILRDPDNINN